MLFRIGTVPLSPVGAPPAPSLPPDSPSVAPDSPSVAPSRTKRARREDESIVSALSYEETVNEGSHVGSVDAAPLPTRQGQVQQAVVTIDEAEHPQAVSEELRDFVDSTMQAASKNIDEFVDTIAQMSPRDDDVEMADENAYVNKRSREYAFHAKPEAGNPVQGKIVMIVLKLYCEENISLTNLSLTIDIGSPDFLPRRCLILRPIYDGILLVNDDKLPYDGIPLDEIMDRENGMKKDWIFSGILPTIWETVNKSYKAWKVPSHSNFHQLFPSGDPECLDELEALVTFSTWDKSTELNSFDELQSHLARAYGNSDGKGHLCLNVVFANAWASSIYQDFANSVSMQKYLVEPEHLNS